MQAAEDLTSAAADGALHVPTGSFFALDDVAAAHRAVEAGARDGRVLLRIA